jgi:RNA polymerase sigma factor (sigma-70 family)
MEPLAHETAVAKSQLRSTQSEMIDYVERIRCGDSTAIEELYSRFFRGIRFFVHRRLGPQEADDKVHDALLIVVEAIRRGALREAACLPGYIRTVVRHLIATHIDRLVTARSRHVELEQAARTNAPGSDPEEEAAAREQREIAQEILLRLSRRDREILTRFYLLEEPKERICREMGLTEVQFRLLKNRAKARFGKTRPGLRQ